MKIKNYTGYIIIFVAVVSLFLFIAICSLKYNYELALNNCIKNGYAENYCKTMLE